MNHSNAARPFFATRFLTCTGITGMLRVAGVCAGVFGFVSGAHAQNTDGVVTAWGDNGLSQCNIPAVSSGVSAIAGGYEHTIALKGGTVVAWGNNGYGQCLGTNSSGSPITSTANGDSAQINGVTLTGVIAIEGGYYHTIALKDGAVLAWGYNEFGQCTIPTAAQSGVSAIAGGYGHTIALKGGAVLAWGENNQGQCTIPATAQSGVSAIAGGLYHTIALKGGAVLAWGYNYYGQCTIPGAANSGVTSIAGGKYHTIALKGGAVLAWGYNGYGQCTIPAAALSGVTAIAGGDFHTIALKGGAVLAWGNNSYGQCNIPATAQSGVSSISSGSNHTIAIFQFKDCNNNGIHDPVDVAAGSTDLNHDKVPDICQGAIEYAATSLSLGVPTANIPVSYTFTGLVPTDADVPLTIRAKGDFEAANEFLTVKVNGVTLGKVFESGAVNCTNATNGGENITAIYVPANDITAAAAVGSLTVTLLPSPTVTGSECSDGFMTIDLRYVGIGPGGDCDNNGKLDVREIGLNPNFDFNHNAILDFCDCRDNEAFDRNRNGILDQLDCLNTPSIDCDSNGHIDTYELFDQPALDCNSNSVLDSCDVAGRQTDKVLAWGYNNSGQCIIPAALSGVSDIAGGYSHTVTLTNDKRVIAWGSNSYGQCLGTTASGSRITTTPTGAPVQILGQVLTGVTAIASGNSHTIALKGGAVLAWGSNSFGQCLGTNISGSPITSTANGAPVQINGVPLSGVTSIASGWDHTLALKGGAVLAWGSNSSGQCTIPVSALSGVSAIAGGYGHTIALKGGAVLAWGYNFEGQCNIPVAAQSGVTSIKGGYRHTVALKDGTVLAWGAGSTTTGGNNYGQSIVPTDAQSGVSAIACGDYHTIALKGGAVLAWGSNSFGQCLGTNISGSPITSTANGTYVQINGFHLSGVTTIASGQNHTIAIQGAIDANNNNRPDTCDMLDDPALDRNNNGIIDALEIVHTPSIDCNRNIIIDDFDLLDHPEWDCNFNARIDTCDFADGASDDDVDGHLDDCEWAKGDFDLDGFVDSKDLGILLLYWLEIDPPFGDFNHDLIIDSSDLGGLLSNFGPVTWGESATVTEHANKPRDQQMR